MLKNNSTSTKESDNNRLRKIREGKWSTKRSKEIIIKNSGGRRAISSSITSQLGEKAKQAIEEEPEVSTDTKLTLMDIIQAEMKPQTPWATDTDEMIVMTM